MSFKHPVKCETPEEREYVRHLRGIEAKRYRVAELQADIAELKQKLASFNAEYHARVGSLFLELDRVRLSIAEYERRIELHLKKPDQSPEEVEEQVAQRFRVRWQRIHEEESSSRQYEQEHEREVIRPPTTDNSNLQMKRIYLELAKRFHPDLARTLEERARGEEIMRRLNEAFQERDLDTLRSLASESEYYDQAFERLPIGEKLIWAIRELDRLDGLIHSLQKEKQAIRSSSTFELWQRQETEPDVVERLKNELAIELSNSRDRLAALVGTYEHLVRGSVE